MTVRDHRGHEARVAPLPALDVIPGVIQIFEHHQDVDFDLDHEIFFSKNIFDFPIQNFFSEGSLSLCHFFTFLSLALFFLKFLKKFIGEK